MAPIKIYGKKKVQSSHSSIFASPLKPARQIEVLQVTDELARLTVSNSQREEQKANKEGRQVLASKSSNAQITVTVDAGIDIQGKTSKPKHATHARHGSPETTDRHARVPDSEAARIVVKPTLPRLVDYTPVDVHQAHVAKLLELSSQPILDFKEWSLQLSEHFSLSKIAEASYGEVYRLSFRQSTDGFARLQESVLKVVALTPPASILATNKTARRRAEWQSQPDDVANEVRLLRHMTCIPGYTNFRDVSIVKGVPGDLFVDAWHSWSDNRVAQGKEASIFPHPTAKNYTRNQLWAVIEMQDAGLDLETVSVDSIWLAWDIFWNVALTIAKGERAAEFEHRDLHLGNICVSRERDMKPFHQERKLGFTNVSTTIIDYTISRAKITDVATSEERQIAYYDLEREHCLFEGDASVDYQYEIYRHMRGMMYLHDPLANVDERWSEAEATGRTWEGFHPRTNLVWLHFLLHQLLKQVSDSQEAVDDKHILDKHNMLKTILQKVDSLLDPRSLMTSRLASADDMIALALKRQWLDVGDVVGR